MGRRLGSKNATKLPDHLRSVSKSVTLTVQEWQQIDTDNPAAAAARILREWIQKQLEKK